VENPTIIFQKSILPKESWGFLRLYNSLSNIVASGKEWSPQ